MEKVASCSPASFQPQPSSPCDREVGVNALLMGIKALSIAFARTDESPVLTIARRFNCFIIDNGPNVRACKPFMIDRNVIGLITPSVLAKLEEYPEVFVCTNKVVKLADTLHDYESRYRAVDRVLRDLKDQNAFITLKGWREECFEVRVDIDANPLMKMERAATCLFGIRQFGVDINGYVNHPKDGICVWLQRRSLTKQRWPGSWDNMVGGGLSVGYNILDTAHKEAEEEASIPPRLLKNLQPRGSVSLFFESERGLSPNTEFVFDLELPLDFIPKNQDGEVSEFHLFPVKEALAIVLSSKFKTTSCPVALDFMVRHEFINSKNEPDLDNLKKLLQIPLPTFYRKLSDDETA